MLKMKFYFLLLIILGVSYCAPVQAENIYVEDNADVVSSQTKEKIYQYNNYYKNLKLHPQLLVVTIEKLPDGHSIESYANKKFNELGIGNSEYDSGILYVIAIADRKQRIEVGYGLEDVLPDALAKDLMSEKAKTYFRDEKYDEGVSIVVNNINDVLQGNKSANEFSPVISNDLSFREILIERIGPIIFGIGFIYALISTPLDKLFIYRKSRKEFARELKKRVKNDDIKYQLYSTKKIIDCKDPSVYKAREIIKKLYHQKSKKKRPLYYDFTYAFGSLTFWELLWKKKKEIQDYSVYYYYRDTWNSGSSNSSYSSGSNDSWGGGSSGGGGASSDW